MALMRTLILLFTLLLLACDSAPPCHPDGDQNVVLPDPPRPDPGPGPTDPGDDDTGYGRTAEGETCRCSLSRDSGCAAEPGGDQPDQQQPTPRPVDGPPALDVPAASSPLCGKIYFCCVEVTGGDAPWHYLDYPVCPKAFGFSTESVITATAAWTVVIHEVKEASEHVVRSGCYESPIVDMAKCGPARPN